MASVHRERYRDTVRYRVSWQDVDGRRKRICVAKQRDANHLANWIQVVVNTQLANRPFDTGTLEWIEGLGDATHKKLVRAGLLEPRQPKDESIATSADMPFVEVIDGYIEHRSSKADNTIRNWRNSREKLAAYFGDRPLAKINAGEADDWQQWMLNTGKAEATVSKATKHAKQFASYAVNKGHALASPFAELKASGERNESRKHFVDRETVGKVLEACNSAEWQAIVALCRFGGLRCPSEVLTLKWSDISLDETRITVTSPKTKRYQKGVRIVPYFPELRPHLEAVREVHPDSEYVIPNYRDADSNLRTHFERIIKRAGVVAWPKIFHNLRASRQTELEEQFPTHVVCAWLGNTESVARDHYLSTTEQHFAQAVSRGANFGQTFAESGGNGGKPCPKSAPSGIVFPGNLGFLGENAAQTIPPRGVATTPEKIERNASRPDFRADFGLNLPSLPQDAMDSPSGWAADEPAADKDPSPLPHVDSPAQLAAMIRATFADLTPWEKARILADAGELVAAAAVARAAIEEHIRNSLAANGDWGASADRLEARTLFSIAKESGVITQAQRNVLSRRYVKLGAFVHGQRAGDAAGLLVHITRAERELSGPVAQDVQDDAPLVESLAE